MSMWIDIYEGPEMPELVAPEPIRAQVILPLAGQDLERYDELCGKAERAEDEIKTIEKQLTLARLRKATYDVEIMQILERRVA